MRPVFLFSRPTLLLCLTTGILWLGWEQAIAAAPITPSGLNTQVSQPVTLPTGQTQFDITGGTRPGGASGTNLFHSFGDFSVPTNNIANFLNAGSVDLNGHILHSNLPTSNILGRITGGDPSAIFGMIQTNGPKGFGTANLFLMNPAGFLFGPNATVNVGGMMTFTTADYLRFQGTDTLFNKVSAPESLSPLSIVPVAAFGFLGSNPAAIAVQGSTLTVAPGQSISLVGGNKGFDYTHPDPGKTASTSVPDGVTMTGGKLRAPGGQINIASVASPGEVLASNLQLQANVDGASFTSLGNVSIGQDARIDTSGTTSGTIAIRGGQLTITDGATITSEASSSPPASAGSVTINGTGVHLTGSDVALNGTNVSVTGAKVTATNLDGSGGTIAITAGSTAQPGNVTVAQGALLDASGNGGGTVLIRGGNFVLDNSTISANVTGSGPVINRVESMGGGIDIVVSQKAEILTGSLLQTNVVGNATPRVTYGGTHIKADRIEIIGDPGFDFEIGPFTEIHSDVASGSTGGNSGPIKLEANSILLQDFVTLQANPNGAGNGGDIILQTTGNLEINGSIVRTTSGFGEVGNIFGNSGNIELTSTTGNILLINGPAITSQAFGSGTPGHIAVSAPAGQVLLTNFDPFTPGFILTNNQGTATIPGTGGIQITAKDLTIVDSAIQIDNFTSVQPGHLSVNLTGTLTLNAPTARTQLLTTTRREAPSADLNITAHDIVATGNSLIATETFRNGDGGTLNIFAQSLELTNGAQIRSSSRFNPFPVPGDPIITPSGAGGVITIQGLEGPAQTVLIDGTGSGIFTNTEGTGAAGNTNITAQSMTIQNGGTISASTSGTVTAQGGDITITAGQSVTLSNGSSISVSSTGAADAGNILINAGQSYTSTNSAVTTHASQASGGNITLLATDMVHLTNSQLNASVQGSSTTVGGNITIDPQFVILQNSQILAQATQGQGGNISITTNLLLPDANSVISASSQFGVNGTITIQSPNAPISGHIQPLGKTPLIATSLLNQHCAALAGGEFSSFTVAGRDSLPTEPGGWLASPLYAAGMGPGVMAEGMKAEGERLEGMSASAGQVASGQWRVGDIQTLSLRQIAPAGFLTQAFAVDWSASCQS